jgi:hypothetical protein
MLKLKSSGFWSMKNLADYEREFDGILRKISATPGPFDFVADLTEHPTQSTEVSDKLKQYGVQMHKVGLRKMACIVSNSALSRMQLERSAGELTTKFFSSEAEARVWLAE